MRHSTSPQSNVGLDGRNHGGDKFTRSEILVYDSNLPVKPVVSADFTNMASWTVFYSGERPKGACESRAKRKAKASAAKDGAAVAKGLKKAKVESPKVKEE